MRNLERKANYSKLFSCSYPYKAGVMVQFQKAPHAGTDIHLYLGNCLFLWRETEANISILLMYIVFTCA